MANKKSVHHWWRVLRFVKVWQLILVLLILGGASIELLRQNNLGMIERRNLVKMADEQGDTAKIETALRELQYYVSSHMNTGMGDKGLYLEKTYQRAYERSVQEGLKNDTSSRRLYDEADAQCQAVFNKTYSFPAYTQCVAEKLAGKTGSDPLNNTKPPSVDLYRYNFVSPAWTPDVAGITLAMAVLLAAILVGRILLVWLLRTLLRQRNQWA